MSEDALFEPDAVLAPQFFATVRRQAPGKTGEYRLVLAVLEDAIHCFQQYAFSSNDGHRQLFAEAAAWLMPARDPQVSDGAPAFSFDYICDVLGLDATYLRRGLQRWHATQLAERRRTLDDERIRAAG